MKKTKTIKQKYLERVKEVERDFWKDMNTQNWEKPSWLQKEFYCLDYVSACKLKDFISNILSHQEQEVKKELCEEIEREFPKIMARNKVRKFPRQAFQDLKQFLTKK